MHKLVIKLVLLTFVINAPSAIYANCGNGNGNGNSCSGSQGPTGPQGDPGTNGSNGTNGLNGTDGKSGADGAKGDKGDSASVDSSAKLVLDTALRLYDGKRLQLQAFNVYGLDRRRNHDVLGGASNVMFGVRLVLKLGTSYEERLVAKQQKELDFLKAMLIKLETENTTVSQK